MSLKQVSRSLLRFTVLNCVPAGQSYASDFADPGSVPNDTHVHTYKPRLQAAYKRLRSVQSAACLPLVRLRQCSASQLLLLRCSKSTHLTSHGQGMNHRVIVLVCNKSYVAALMPARTASMLGCASLTHTATTH